MIISYDMQLSGCLFCLFLLLKKKKKKKKKMPLPLECLPPVELTRELVACAARPAEPSRTPARP